jgi:hypothetical protein
MPLNKTTLNSLLKAGINHGLKYVTGSNSIIALEDLIDEILQTPVEKSHNTWVRASRRKYFALSLYFCDRQTFILGIDPINIPWEKKILGGKSIDLPEYIKWLLVFSKPFIINSVYTHSDLQIFFNRVPSKSIAIAIDTPNYFENGAPFPQGILCRILKQGQLLDEQTAMPTKEDIMVIYKKFVYAHENKLPITFFLETTSNHRVSLTIIDNEIMLKPAEPIKIKTVDGQMGLDIQWYTKLLLEIFQGIGILEIASNFE